MSSKVKDISKKVAAALLGQRTAEIIGNGWSCTVEILDISYTTIYPKIAGTIWIDSEVEIYRKRNMRMGHRVIIENTEYIISKFKRASEKTVSIKLKYLLSHVSS